MKPTAGLWATSSAKSSSGCVEIRITWNLAAPSVLASWRATVKAAVLTEIDVQQDQIGSQLGRELEAFCASRRDPHDAEPLPLE